MSELSNVTHPFEPIYDADSTILILGTIPSVESRKREFYYAHPRNSFWKIIAYICGTGIPLTIDEKKDLLLRNHIAIWDVCKSCDIKNSDDSSIRNVVPTDIPSIINKTKIKRIYANSQKAATQYNRFVRQKIGIEIVTLPSTSPAFCKISDEEKMKIWKELIQLDLE